jgi:hypothetical protein
MKISQLTFLGFFLNGVHGTGKYDQITKNMVKSELEKSTLFQFLDRELGSDIDTSILSEQEKRELNSEWLDISQSVDEKRKMGVEKGGLCLLVAYVFESIQRLQYAN